jgi:hypothetical protein
VWLANPIDAFSARDQGRWLDWSRGEASGRGALERAAVVLVVRGSAADRLTAREPGLRRLGADGGAVLYARTAAPSERPTPSSRGD